MIFSLNDQEKTKADCFITEHYGHNPSDYKYIFSPGAGIGTIIKIKCAKCKEKLDITDYGAW